MTNNSSLSFFLCRRPVRSVRLSRARKQKSEAKAAAIVKLEDDEVNGKVPDAELTAEELLKMQEVL